MILMASPPFAACAPLRSSSSNRVSRQLASWGTDSYAVALAVLLLTDLRVCVASTVFGSRDPNGLLGCAEALTNGNGSSMALEHMLLGQEVTAAAALDRHLVQRVADSMGDLPDVVAQLTADIIAVSPAVIKPTLALFRPTTGLREVTSCYASALLDTPMHCGQTPAGIAVEVTAEAIVVRVECSAFTADVSRYLRSLFNPDLRVILHLGTADSAFDPPICN
jgi:hypothetical protein